MMPLDALASIVGKVEAPYADLEVRRLGPAHRQHQPIAPDRQRVRSAGAEL
jgi:hypothetical protein